jgi:hypothetical protein
VKSVLNDLDPFDYAVTCLAPSLTHHRIKNEMSQIVPPIETMRPRPQIHAARRSRS